MPKLLYKFVTSGLVVTFIVLFSISFDTFLKNETGTTLKIENNGSFPDLTICPYTYQSNIDVITGESNDTIANLNSLPSMKDGIKLIQTGQNGYITLDDIQSRFMSVVNGGEYLQDNENDFWHETIRLSNLIPNSAQKCIILQWPSILNLTGQPFVMIAIDNTFMKEMMILLHSRGNSEVVNDIKEYNNFIYMDQLGPGTVYLLSSKAKKKVTHCKPEKSQKYECIMSFIASQMNCSIELEKSYFPEDYPLCQSKEELKSYLDLKLSIYQHRYDDQLQQCFETKCYERYWIAKHWGDLDKDILGTLPQLAEFEDQNLTVVMIGFNNLEVEVTEEYFLYGLTNLISDFGGYSGLFLGVSILSLIEWLSDKLDDWWKMKKTKKTATEKYFEDKESSC